MVHQGDFEFAYGVFHVCSMVQTKMLGEATGIPVALPDIRFMFRPPALDIHSGTNIVCGVGTWAEDVIYQIGCVTSYSLVNLVSQPIKPRLHFCSDL